ncbi:hypothetical protein OG937_11795 [Streptomyces sp. NBC_00510]
MTSEATVATFIQPIGVLAPDREAGCAAGGDTEAVDKEVAP